MTTPMRIFNCLAVLLTSVLAASAAASQTVIEAVPEAPLPSVTAPLPDLDAARLGQHTRLPPFDFSLADSATLAAPVQLHSARPGSAFRSAQYRLGHYAKWGMVIGAAAGLGYGLTREDDDVFGLSPVLETGIGLGLGLFAGATLDLLTSLRGTGAADR